MGPEAEFQSYLEEGRFMIQRSRSTGSYVFYPRAFVPGTGERDLEWIEASGEGVVYATTANRRSPGKGGTFNIALIDMAEGVRMLSRVVGVEPDAVRIGQAVRAKIDRVNGEPAVVWEIVT